MASIAKANTSAAISNEAARLAIAAIATYQVLLIVLIFLRSDLDPSWHTISEWAIGPHGWIMSAAFLISSVAVSNSSRIEVSIRAHLHFLMEFDTAIKAPEELSLSYR